MKTIQKSGYLQKEVELNVIGYKKSEDGKTTYIVKHDDLMDLILNDEHCVNNGVSYHCVDIPLHERTHYAVRCIITDKNGRRVEAIGESIPKTLTTEIARDYAYLMADKRAFDSAAARFLQFDNKVYSEEEIMDLPASGFTLVHGGKSEKKPDDAARVDPAASSPKEAPAATGKDRKRRTSPPGKAGNVTAGAVNETGTSADAPENDATAPAPVETTPAEKATAEKPEAAAAREMVQSGSNPGKNGEPVDLTGMLAGSESNPSEESGDAAAEEANTVSPSADQPTQDQRSQSTDETTTTAPDGNSAEGGETGEPAASTEWLTTRLGEFRDPKDPFSLVVKYGTYRAKGLTIRELAKLNMVDFKWLTTMLAQSEKAKETKLVACKYMEVLGMDTETGSAIMKEGESAA